MIADYNQAVMHAVGEVAAEGATLQGLERQGAALVAAATRRLNHGLADRSALLQAKQALLRQEEIRLQQQDAELQAEVALIKALGGGNWIKVVQRVPVRVALDPKELAAHPLRVGLSATASIDITQKGSGALGAVAAPAPQRYATTALNQPVEQARAATDAIVARNLAN